MSARELWPRPRISQSRAFNLLLLPTPGFPLGAHTTLASLVQPTAPMSSAVHESRRRRQDVSGRALPAPGAKTYLGRQFSPGPGHTALVLVGPPHYLRGPLGRRAPPQHAGFLPAFGRRAPPLAPGVFSRSLPPLRAFSAGDFQPALSLGHQHPVGHTSGAAFPHALRDLTRSAHGRPRLPAL